MKADLELNKNLLLAQAHVLAVEHRPEACLGCGFEHGCSLHGCAVMNRLIELVAENYTQTKTED